MSKETKGSVAEQYVQQRYAHITQSEERMKFWIHEALWSFADEMEEGRLEDEIKAWDDEEEANQEGE